MAAAGVAGCATVKQTHLANGMPAYLVNCEVSLTGHDLCYRKAGDLCGYRGYTLYDWKGRVLPMQKPIPGSDSDDFDTSAPTTILIACNPWGRW